MDIRAAAEMIGKREFALLKTELREMMPADIAELLTELYRSEENFGEKDLSLLFRILPKDTAADVFTFLDTDLQKVLINAFSESELREVLDDLFLEFLFRLRNFKSFVVGDLAGVGTSNFFVIVACFVKDYVQAFFQFFHALVYCLFYDFLFCFFGCMIVATYEADSHCESESKCHF